MVGQEDRFAYKSRSLHIRSTPDLDWPGLSVVLVLVVVVVVVVMLVVGWVAAGRPGTGNKKKMGIYIVHYV